MTQDAAHAPLPYSHPVAVATLHGDAHLILRPDAAERAAIAQSLGLEAIDALILDLAIRHAQSGLVTLNGTLKAQVKPVCVVSLEPFDQVIEAPLSLRFAPEALAERMIKRAEDDGIEDFEPPDIIEDGVIDFGQVASEFLALSVDPYPRKPGAEFSGAGDPPEVRESPFAVLAALKDKD